MSKLLGFGNLNYVKILILILGFISLLYNCSSGENDLQKNADLASTSDSTEFEYIGSEACMPCHAQKYEGFMQTGMGRSFGKATPARSDAWNKPVNLVYDTLNDFYYEPIWLDSGLFIKEFRLFEQDTLYARIEKVDYIIGSGHHTNSHLMNKNGFLYQMPITFYSQQGFWDLAPGYREHNARFSRRIEMECISCHNAYPDVSDSAYHFYHQIPLGISCERCHGPGAKHVEMMVQGKFDSLDQKHIINPSHLPWELQVDVCQRCHLQGNIVLEPGKKFTDFRPGMSLSEVFTVFMPQYMDGKEFRMAAHAERFQMSACFKEQASLDFTCISCHDPHHSVRKTNTDKFNLTCKGCHSESHACKASQAELIVTQNNCVVCHMPSSGAIDIPHVTVHDHWITTPQKRSAALSNQGSQPEALYAVNNPNPNVASVFAAYISYFEKFDRNVLYLNKARELYPLLDDSEYSASLKIYFHYTSNEFQSIISLIEELKYEFSADAWSNYRIAKAYENNRDYKKAYQYLLRATELKPLFIPFWLDLIIIEIDLEKYKQAELNVNRVLQWDPCESRALSQLARLYFLQNDLRNAGIAAQKALRCDPDNKVALEIASRFAQHSGITTPLLRYQDKRSQDRDSL